MTIPTHETRPCYNVLILSNHDEGPEEVALFEAGDDPDADGKALSAYALSRGYRGEYDDFWIFLGAHVSSAADLASRPRAGRFAAAGSIQAERDAARRGRR